MYVSSFFVRVIAAELRRRGVSTQALLARVGLDAASLDDPTVRLPVEIYERVVAEARALVRDDRDPGLHVGEGWPTTGYLVGHLFSNAASIRESVALATRFRPLVHAQMELSIREGSDRAEVIYRNTSTSPENARFEAEAMLTFLLRMGQLLSGVHEPPSEVRFVHARPESTAEHVRIFGVEPRFGTSANALVFPRAVLDRPNVHRDPSLRVLLEEHAERLLARQGDDAHLVEQLRRSLRAHGELGRPSLDRIAQRMGTSGRVLQRRLHGLGTSLSALADDVRREVACDHVREGVVPLKELAERLGFSEPSAFHRAFRRWTGTTPAAFRASGAPLSDARASRAPAPPPLAALAGSEAR